MHWLRTMKKTCLILSIALFGACSTSATDIGDAQVNGQTIHVAREGDMPAAGVTTTIVFKATTGTKPDAIKGWVGLAEVEASAKVAAVYDANDGDFDDDITCPTPLPAGSKIWFDVTTGETTTTASVEIK
ncbi:MAG: hypothetical protein ABI678_29635 [Kofleriaceae bacterium]